MELANFWDPNYLLWLVPLPPLISFTLIVLVVGSNKLLSHLVALGSVLLSWLLAWGLFFHAAGVVGQGNVADFGAVAFGSSIDWMNLGTRDPFQMGVLMDPLTAVMLFMVPLAIVMIFVYSVGYMNAYPPDDPHQTRHTRFFCVFEPVRGGHAHPGGGG
ncbi:MAG: hypothetical protein HC915_04520 [Anaerolineae bacterium]|nr:hypothetical protein [Anaerolineae bacterium]